MLTGAFGARMQPRPTRSTNQVHQPWSQAIQPRTPNSLGDFYHVERRDGGCAPSRCAALPHPMCARAAWPRSPNFGRPEKAAYSLAARPTLSTAHVNFLRRGPLSQCPYPHLARPMSPCAGGRCSLCSR